MARRKINDSEMEVQVIICGIRSEIDLDGLELLKLEFGQPGTCVMCTFGKKFSRTSLFAVRAGTDSGDVVNQAFSVEEVERRKQSFMEMWWYLLPIVE